LLTPLGLVVARATGVAGRDEAERVERINVLLTSHTKTICPRLTAAELAPFTQR